MNKIFNLVSEAWRSTLKPKLVILDSKISTFVPNPKIKKILYITIGSLFGFIFLIIILGILLSPFKNVPQESGLILNKPSIVNTSPEPQKELSEVKKQILKLEIEIKELRFPESSLNIPAVETGLKI